MNSPQSAKIAYAAAMAALTQRPAGMSISPTSGLIAWTPTASQAGSHPVTVQVIDAGGLGAVQAFTIAVTTANSPPPNTATPGGGTTPPAVASSGSGSGGGSGGGGGGGGCAMRIDGEPDAVMAMLALLALFCVVRGRRRTYPLRGFLHKRNAHFTEP